MSAAQTQKDAERFARELGVSVEDFVRVVGQELTGEVIRATPVISGFLKNSWTAQLNAPSSKPLMDKQSTIPPDPVGEVNMVFGAMDAGDVVYVTNGARYAYYVEYGTSRMTPRAFVRNTLNRLSAITQQAAARIRNMR